MSNEKEFETVSKNELPTPGVVLVSLGVGVDSLRNTLRRIDDVTASYPETLLFLSMHAGLDLRNYTESLSLEDEFPNLEVLGWDEAGEYNFAIAYLKGLQHALKSGADIIIEIDSGGGHLPEEMSRFIDFDQQDTDAIFSSRILPGSVNTYPLQRKFVSQFGTYLVNRVFSRFGILSDMTSGYESFTSSFLARLLESNSPENWLCVGKNAPFHIYQTEMRLRSLVAGVSYLEVPISYGMEKRGKNLGLGYIFKSLYYFYLLSLELNK